MVLKEPCGIVRISFKEDLVEHKDIDKDIIICGHKKKIKVKYMEYDSSRPHQ